MTTLTTTQILLLRRRAGDTTAPQDLADNEVDALYTDATLGNFSLNSTTYYYVQERMGIAVNSVAVSNPMGGITRNQKYEQLERLLAYWSTITGINQPPINEGGFEEWDQNVSPANLP